MSHHGFLPDVKGPHIRMVRLTQLRDLGGFRLLNILRNQLHPNLHCANDW